MTAAVAIFSTVAMPCPGPIDPSTMSASRPEDNTIFETRSFVGMTTGRPSVKPC